VTIDLISQAGRLPNHTIMKANTC